MYVIRCRTKSEPLKDYYVEDLWEDQTVLYNTSIQLAKKFETESAARKMGLNLIAAKKITLYKIEEIKSEDKKMKTAYEAFKETQERVKGLAKEFIWNTANAEIQKAIDAGIYETEILTEFNLYDSVGKEVIRMLGEQGYIVELNNRTLTIQWAVEDDGGNLYPAEDPVIENPKKTEPEYTREGKEVFAGVANTSRDLMRFLDDLPNMPFDNGAQVTVTVTKDERVRLTIFGGGVRG